MEPVSWPASTASAVGRLLDRARRRSDLPVVLCVDVEPDDRVFDRRDPRPWLGFERFLQRLPAMRERLSRATGAPVAFTWCLRMDPQVEETWGSAGWVADAYGEAFAELAGRGDELGLHTHTWRWETEAGQWVADYDDPVWGKHGVVTALDAFEMAFGRACAVHRGGDRFLSGAMLSCLETRGVQVDLTVEPGLRPLAAAEGERARGLSPDYRGVPTRPYRSSAGKFPAPDLTSRTGLLLVPLMSAPGRRFLRPSPLSPAAGTVRFVPRLAAELLRAPPPVLATVVRSDIALSSAWGPFVNNLEHLGRHRRVAFTTATAAVARIGTRDV